MKRNVTCIAAIIFLTSLCYKELSLSPGGSWTFRSVSSQAGKFQVHSSSLAVWDTTQHPNTKLIFDFYKDMPAASGRYRVIRGMPKAADQVSVGVGSLVRGGLIFYSSTGGSGKETIMVTVARGKMTISATGIEMANQTAQNDKAPLSFNITKAQ